MKRLTRIASFALSLVLLGPAALSAQEVTLRLNLNQGDSHRINTTTEQRIEQEMQGITQTIEQTIGMGMNLEVLEVDDEGNYRIRMTYDSVRYVQEGPMGRTEYDSEQADGEPAAPMAQGFAALVGEGYEATLTPLGRVTEVSGVDRMIDNMLGKIELEGAARGMVEQTMRSQFNDEAMQASMEMMSAIYPEEPVAVGDTWEQEMEANFGFPMAMETTWTLEEVEGGVATLSVEADITSPEDAEPMEMGPVKMTFALEGRQTGTMKLDEESGWTREANFEQDMEGQMEVEAPNQPQPLAIPMKIQSTITIDSGAQGRG